MLSTPHCVGLGKSRAGKCTSDVFLQEEVWADVRNEHPSVWKGKGEVSGERVGETRWPCPATPAGSRGSLAVPGHLLISAFSLVSTSAAVALPSRWDLSPGKAAGLVVVNPGRSL